MYPSLQLWETVIRASTRDGAVGTASEGALYGLRVTVLPRSCLAEAAECFRYTSQGGSTQIPGTDDLADLERVRNALAVLGKDFWNPPCKVTSSVDFSDWWFHGVCSLHPGIRSDQQMELFRILSAVLHLGNIGIQASGRGGDRSYVNARKPLFFCKIFPSYFVNVQAFVKAGYNYTICTPPYSMTLEDH